MKTETYDKLAGVCFTIALTLFTLKMFILPIFMIVNGELTGIILLVISVAIAYGVFRFIRFMWRDINSGFKL